MHTTKKKTTEQFINEAEDVHNGEYDYSKVEYVNNVTPVCIICREHGEFWQTPKQHLRGQGCPECGKRKNKKNKSYKIKENDHRGKKYTKKEFIYLLKEKFGEKCEYDKVEYVNIKTPVCLTCKIHGDFWKLPNKLLYRQSGCPECGKENKRKMFSLGEENFIKKANDIHHGLYTYENVKYVNNATKVEITCRKHGSFFCTPGNHLKGRGCPICKSENNVYEERLYQFLLTIFSENDIIRQYHDTFLSNNKSIDFYIPKYKLGIEHQGSQHFFSNFYKVVDTQEKLERRMKNDKEKIIECEKNGVNLLHFTYEISYKPENCFYDLIFKEDELKNKILSIIENE